jgi:hypothetical protein
MAVKVVHVSDLSDKEADEHELGRLVIHQHPGYADLPVTLEVLPEEVNGLASAPRLVTVEWIPPGARTGTRLVVDLEEFDRLAGGQGMKPVIGRAIIAKHEAGASTAAQHRGRRGGRPARVSYASLAMPGSRTVGGSPRRRSSWSASTSTRSTSGLPPRACARSTPRTRSCAGATGCSNPQDRRQRERHVAR